MYKRAALLAMLAIVIGGCGTSLTRTAATANSVSTPTRVIKSRSGTSACHSPSEPYERSCNLAYKVCGATARAEIKAYYHETGPTPETIAKRYARETYTPREGEPSGDNADHSGGEAGCYSALMDEYDRLYGR